jgi:hypothetical protein
MPGYLSKAFLRFKHEIPHKKQNSPHPHVILNYRAKAQFTEPEDNLPLLGKEETKIVQAVAGTLLYYGCAVFSMILTALSSLATEQAKPTAKTMAKITQLLDYLATQEDAIMTYNASNTILQVHSIAGYANEKKALSHAGGNFFLSNNNTSPPYLEADVRRNERKMGGFKSWEIFGTGFDIPVFFQFFCDVQVSKFWIFPQFPAIFRVPKNSQNADFSAVSWDFEGRARPKILCGFSRNEQGSKSGFSCGVPQFLGDPKKSRNPVFPTDSRDFKGRARPIFFGTQTSPQFSWDFEVLDPPK